MSKVIIRIGAAYDEAVINGIKIDRAKARQEIAASVAVDGGNFGNMYRSFNEELGRAVCLHAAIKAQKASRKQRYNRRANHG